MAGRVRARSRGLADRPLAAISIARRLGVPRRAIAIIEGESLVNDGTALVLYKFAVAAVLTGSFSLLHATWSLIWSVLGGIAVGLVIGRAIRFVRRRVFNPPLEVTIAFLTGYFTFLPAPRSARRGCSRSSPPVSTWAGTRRS